MLFYRLAKTSRATDLTGEGARRAGGRWNFAGTPVVYTAQSGALAILEVLQYAQEADIRLFSMLTLDVPDTALIQRVSLDGLPADWLQYPYLEATRLIGQRWMEKVEALLLQVPSAVYPDESNWLINPQHPEVATIRIVSVKPFTFSERLFRRV